jgi:hypothetical protein
MKQKIFLVLISAMLVALFIVGFNSATANAAQVPSTVTVAAPTSAPIATTVAPTPGAQLSADYNGEWKGTTSSDGSFSLIVDNNQLTYFNLNYSGAIGTCQNLSLSYAKSLENAPIKGKDFSAQATFENGDQITLAGSFKSSAEVSGAFTIKSTGNMCGAFDIKGTFSAQNGGGATASASSPVAGDSASKTLRAFFDAVNAKNVDAALALVDDTITFNIGSTTGVGKAQLKTYLQNQISRGVSYTLSNLDDQGDSVDFSLKTGNGAVTDDNNASFNDDGKIDFMMVN